MGVSHLVRRASPDDLATLPAIEQVAARRFAGLPIEAGVRADMTSPAEFAAAQRAGRLWVATVGGTVVGFALAHDLDGAVHLDELDVHPDHGRTGIGTDLVRAVCTEAAGHGCPAVTLTTFRDVPWNRPFYERLGFRVLAGTELSHALTELLQREDAAGLRCVDRVVMIYEMPRDDPPQPT